MQILCSILSSSSFLCDCYNAYYRVKVLNEGTLNFLSSSLVNQGPIIADVFSGLLYSRSRMEGNFT
jgi:hypothetical protein